MQESTKFCSACGAQNNLSAQFCQKCGAQYIGMPPPSKLEQLRTSYPILWGLISVLVLIFFSVVLMKSQSKPVLVEAYDHAPTSTPALSPTPMSSPTPIPSAWEYSEGADSMTGKTTATASLVSTNSFEFGFPYNGTQRAALTLRKHPRYGKDIILSIERGQFMPGIDGVAVLARFDNGKPVRFWAMGPADNGTTTLFIRNYEHFVSALQKAERVQISTTVYQEGEQVFNFYCAGLRAF